MAFDPAEWASTRALRYLELRGVQPTQQTRARVEAIVAGAPRQDIGGLLAAVFDALPEAFELAEPEIPCPAPEIRRTSMGYPEP